MKALSVKQPWAEFIASGRKTVETRTWRTKYRGPLLICASRNRHEEAFKWFENGTWITGIDMTISFPLGVAVAIVELIDVRQMVNADCKAAMCELNKYAWVLKNVRRVDPFPVKGELGLFEVPLIEADKGDARLSQKGDNGEKA